MNETSGSLSDTVGGVTMAPVSSSAFTYGVSSVPAGTYGAITVSPAVASAFGTAVAANGSSIFLNSTSGNALNSIAAPLTVMAWVDPTTLTAADQNTRYISAVSGQFNSWGYGYHSTGDQLFTTYGKTDYTQPSGSLVTAGTWQNVAVVFSGTTATYYLNGNMVGSASGSNFPANTNAIFSLFGVDSAANPEYFTGSMDDVRVYNTALTASQIVSEATNVPEPASLSALGILGLAFLSRRRRRTA